MVPPACNSNDLVRWGFFVRRLWFFWDLLLFNLLSGRQSPSFSVDGLNLLALDPNLARISVWWVFEAIHPGFLDWWVFSADEVCFQPIGASTRPRCPSRFLCGDPSSRQASSSLTHFFVRVYVWVGFFIAIGYALLFWVFLLGYVFDVTRLKPFSSNEFPPCLNFTTDHAY